jgi:hypothetical protein
VLRLFSSMPLEVEQLPAPLALVLGGQWTGLLAGGPASAPTFGSNPQYMLSVSTKAKVGCILFDEPAISFLELTRSTWLKPPVHAQCVH